MDLTVDVFKAGRRIGTIQRPLRSLRGKPAVTYRGRLWEVVGGNRIEVASTARSSVPKPTDGIPANQDKASAKQPTVELKSDKQQRAVIEAPKYERLLVDAGPGTGKTAVACARVAWLVNECGCQPGRIWLISFTRTAVREIRNRISSYLKDHESVWAVKIATLDSHAWAIHSGFEEGSKLFGSYDENIEKVLEMVRSDPAVSEYLEDRVDHLIVDEAQDIVGIRAALVLALIEKLRYDCGVTVFSDDAQAIYGFTEDDSGGKSADVETLPQEIRKCPLNPPFREARLTKVFRTSSPGLLKIFCDIRAAVLTPSREPAKKRAQLRSEIKRAADGAVPPVDQQQLSGRSEVLVLYRRRVDVLLASSFLSSAGVVHRIRMSGLPVSLQPWVAAALSEHVAAKLTEPEFLEYWTAKVSNTPLDVIKVEEAWHQLVKLAGTDQNSVDMRVLRERLGRKQPPADFCNPEFGERGPIIGTIHASKGREAEDVHLMLSDGGNENTDQDEETRVDFVGATRARVHLRVGTGYRQWASQLQRSGRVFSRMLQGGNPYAQVEIGRDGDMTAEGLAGRGSFDQCGDAKAAQALLLENAGKLESVYCLLTKKSTRWVYELRLVEGNGLLGVLSSQVNTDLFSIGDSLGLGRRRPPQYIKHIWLVGVCSVVIPAESPQLETLHMPWRQSGIVLAPLFIGYTKTFFPFARRR